MAGRFELAGKALGDDAFVSPPVFAEQKTQLFGFNHAGCSACLAVMHQRFGNVAGHPLLIGKAVPDRVNLSLIHI